MKKGLVFILIIFILINLPFQVLAQQNTSDDEIKVYVNDTRINFDVPPIFVKSFTMVPVRAVFEALGAKIEWDNYTKTVTIRRGETEVRVQPGNRIAMVNNVSYVMDVPALGLNGRILVPVRFISEAIGAKVDWVNETKTVFINDLTEQKELGNIMNGGKFAAADGYYYHILPDGVMVRENILTKQMEKIADNIVHDIYLVNDRIYCIGKVKGVNRIISMKKDGSEKTVITNRPVNTMQISNGWIYYSETNDDSTLYRVKTDGNETAKIIENGDFSSKNWFVRNGWVYYVDKNEQLIARARIDGSDKRNLTGRITDLSSRKNIYGLKLIDKDYIYVELYENVTDINRTKYTVGLYRIPVNGGEPVKITDKVPLSVNMDDRWIYMTVENHDGKYKLLRCKKDGSEVITINEYKEGDVPKNIYLNGALIFYTVLRGEESPEELLFCMGSFGDNIQQYSWIYGKDYYSVNKILTDSYAAYMSLNSFQTIQTSILENENGRNSVNYESTINRTRSLFYKKTVIGEQSNFETWLVQDTLYSKKNDETHWDIVKINKQDAASMQKLIFDYIQPTDELCNNLSIEETENSYVLKGEGSFRYFIKNILPCLDLDETVDVDMANLKIKVNKQKKYIEELELSITYNSDPKENGDIKQYVNNYHYINSQFNSAYLNMPYSINQSVKAKENAEKSIENGVEKFNEGKYDEAIKLFDTALGLYNKSSIAYLYKGKSQYNLERYKEAILTYTQYHDINPSDTEVFALIGMCYWKMGDLQKAEEMGYEALKYNQSVNAYNLLGNVASERQEYKTATEYFSKAVSLDNKNYSSRLYLASTLLTMGNYTRCIEAVDSSLKHFPRDRELLYIKANCLTNQGRYEQAIKVYEEILSSNPSNDFVTMTYIAREYELLQDYRKAKEYAEMAKAVYPDYNLLKYLLDKLDYDLTTNSIQRLVDFINENYLYYNKSEDINKKLETFIEKGDLFTVEDVRNLIDSIKTADDNLTGMVTGYEYDYYFGSEKGNSFDTRQDENYVYVKVKNLYTGTGVQVVEFIQSIENSENKILILDLRDNKSGLSDEANIILDALLPECTPSYIIDREGYVRTFTSGKWHTPFLKIGILVNENTASSAELLTLGLKTFAKNVTIIGNKTAGKGVGQTVYFDRSRKLAIFLVNHYWNILQQNIEGKGIEADIQVDGSESDYLRIINEFLNEN